MQRFFSTACTSVLVFMATVASAAAPASPAAPIVAWNARILSIAAAEDGFLTLKGVRTAAMLHLAMHDAINSVQPRYDAYVLQESVPDADPLTAALRAAYAIAVAQYPQQREQLAALQMQWLPGDASSVSLELGDAAAQAILDARRDDGWDNEAEYQWHPMAPGVYAEFSEHSNTPAGFVFGAGWATARPFALQRADQFRAPPPPAIDSDAYARAYEEVKSVGRFQSDTRTPDQTHLALWWKDFAENSHNRLARDLALQDSLSLAATARLFALLNVAIFDAYVSVFDNKFHYNHWRPYTAIRWAANDGNPDTVAEETWTNTHRHTYAFPSYPSAHGTACAAAMTVMADTFGDEHAFTMRIPEVDIAGPFSGKMAMRPPTRDFASFADAARECAMSRLYLGIHFRYDSIEGNKLGRDIGRYVTGHYLRPSS